jgi:hypothetical protein
MEHFASQIHLAAVRTVVRIKPLSQTNIGTLTIERPQCSKTSRCSLLLHHPDTNGNSDSEEHVAYNFDEVCDETTDQETVFKQVGA